MNVCVIQARMGSTRFPGKSMELLEGKPLICWSLRNALRIPGVSRVFLATTVSKEDDALAALAADWGVEIYRGHSSNVFSRFVDIADLTGAENFIRMTADNPITPLDLASQTLSAHLYGQVDYTSTILARTFPIGSDIECFTKSALERLAKENLSDQELEHVTLGFRSRPHKFSLLSPMQSEDLSNLELTIDTPDDLRRLQALFRNAPDDWDKKLSDVVHRWHEVMSREENY